MPEPSPLISIIMPAHNTETYIAEAIRSVLEQPVTDFELIIINNGSTDQTSQIVKQFDDPRIHLLETEKLGPSGARNVGLTQVQGRYVTFLDADDVYLPETLTFFINTFQKHPELDLIYGGHALYCNADLRPIANSKKRIKTSQSLETFANRFPAAALFENTMGSQLSSIMIRTETARQIGLFDTTLTIGEDFEWILRLLGVAKTRVFLNRFSIYYRCISTSLMRSPETLLKRIEGSQKIISIICQHDFKDIQVNKKRAYYAARKWLDLCDNMLGNGYQPLAVQMLRQFYQESYFPKLPFFIRLCKLSVKMVLSSLKLRQNAMPETNQPAFRTRTLATNIE